VFGVEREDIEVAKLKARFADDTMVRREYCVTTIERVENVYGVIPCYHDARNASSLAGPRSLAREAPNINASRIVDPDLARGNHGIDVQPTL
jgi:hypothetical protein